MTPIQTPRSTRSALRSFAAAFPALVLTALACNSVLGIDEAELDPARVNGSAGSGSATISRTYIPVQGCTVPTASCSTCLQLHCAAPLANCLATQSCRRALDDHRVCLEADCKVGDIDSWTGCAELSQEFDTPLMNCVVNDCAADCTGSPLVDMCDLMCACKQQTCTNTLDATDPINCRSRCMMLGEDRGLAYCRFKHCQVADTPGSFHCEHADGTHQCETGAIVSNACDYAAAAGFPCPSDSDDECCSGKCTSQVCEP